MADAFETGLIEALPALRRYALSLCRKRDLADDLMQTAVEPAIAGRGRFDPETRLEPWLFRILRKCLDRHHAAGGHAGRRDRHRRYARGRGP